MLITEAAIGESLLASCILINAEKFIYSARQEELWSGIRADCAREAGVERGRRGEKREERSLNIKGSLRNTTFASVLRQGGDRPKGLA